MIASILIILVSSALLVYWFRYTCLLVLKSRTGKDYAAATAAANGLKFYGIQGRAIQDSSNAELPALQKSLERDYRLLTYLIQHTTGLEVGGVTIEQRMLMLDFKVMRLVFGLGRVLGAGCARAALQEMSSILNHLANAMGERIENATQP